MQLQPNSTKMSIMIVSLEYVAIIKYRNWHTIECILLLVLFGIFRWIIFAILLHKVYTLLLFYYLRSELSILVTD
jgi:hypothetical protein